MIQKLMCNIEISLSFGLRLGLIDRIRFNNAFEDWFIHNSGCGEELRS
ncbi:MAG: hypothetical protein KKD65_08395 [Gammaproteobacteria bacterium]|nr:hypothetical protein [Gammaproteobacteria bacterium]